MFYLIFIVNPWCSIVLRKRKWKFKNNWIYKDYIALTIWIKILTNLIFPDFKALVFTILLNQLLTYFAQWKVAQLLSEGCSVVSNSLQSHGLYSPWNSPGQNTGVGSLSLLQGVFTIQGSNPGLPHCRWILYQLSHKGSPRTLEWVAYPFSRRYSQPRNPTRYPELQVASLLTELCGKPQVK